MPMTIINNRMGHNTLTRTLPVGANQTIRKGDLVKYASGLVVKAAIGDAPLLGVATHDITTGGAPTYDGTSKNRLTTEIFHAAGEYLGDVKTGVIVNNALRGSAAGFIDEGGRIKLDPAATVKQAVIVDIRHIDVAGDDVTEVMFKIHDLANRVE